MVRLSNKAAYIIYNLSPLWLLTMSVIVNHLAAGRPHVTVYVTTGSNLFRHSQFHVYLFGSDIN